jgi:hypothetical protein
MYEKTSLRIVFLKYKRLLGRKLNFVISWIYFNLFLERAAKINTILSGIV